ncbi:GrpE-domain-containing protein [Xylariomycetidae sp. FL0641]|nr:GrpE-domain-containing protein [Xylariomycetidae sp. FL0641]
MFRQALSTSTRALCSSSRTIAQRPVVRSHFSPAPATSFRVALSPSTRWYSDKTESAAKKEGEESTSQVEAQDGKEANESKEANAPSDAEAECLKKLAQKEREAIDWKDKALRSVAEFRNLQDRTAREMKAARDFAIQKFAKDLVDTVDNLDRALNMVAEKMKAEGAEEGKTENQDLKNFYDGVKMTETNMLSTLSKHGLERFDPQGEKFNPNEHEATFMTPMPDKEDNTVFFVQQKGFKLNGRILRAAKVGVVKSQ